jgi:hypothetical protein
MYGVFLSLQDAVTRGWAACGCCSHAESSARPGLLLIVLARYHAPTPNPRPMHASNMMLVRLWHA